MTELPEQDELVIVVIKKILPYGAFCALQEYGNKEAFLHVSEVAPRWIKNIHEFISEGQRHVAKVYRLDLEKHQIDISLKRVSEEEKKHKLEFARTQKRGEMLLLQAIKISEAKVDAKEATTILEDQFGSVYGAFEAAAEEGKTALKEVNLPEKLLKQIIEIAKKNIKKAEVSVDGVLTLAFFGSSGIEDVRKALETKAKGIEIHYLGAPHYKLAATAKTYKDAEKLLGEAVEGIKGFALKNNGEATFEKTKK
jgi:translation initiation factor 2 subunit 1